LAGTLQLPDLVVGAPGYKGALEQQGRAVVIEAIQFSNVSLAITNDLAPGATAAYTGSAVTMSVRAANAGPYATPKGTTVAVTLPPRAVFGPPAQTPAGCTVKGDTATCDMYVPATATAVRGGQCLMRA
jgi:hypothetical protein